MKYVVRVNVVCEHEVEVRASSLDDAVNKAERMVMSRICSGDSGWKDAEVIGSTIISGGEKDEGNNK